MDQSIGCSMITAEMQKKKKQDIKPLSWRLLRARRRGGQGECGFLQGALLRVQYGFENRWIIDFSTQRNRGFASVQTAGVRELRPIA